jgi:hypothetical protein
MNSDAMNMIGCALISNTAICEVSRLLAEREPTRSVSSDIWQESSMPYSKSVWSVFGPTVRELCTNEAIAAWLCTIRTCPAPTFRWVDDSPFRTLCFSSAT